jgi:hypothetical protein
MAKIDLFQTLKGQKTKVEKADFKTAVMDLAQSAGVRGDQVYITTSGYHSGDSGLSPGARYFLNDTQGTKGTSAGSQTIRMGVALSATEFFVRIEH